MDDEISYHRPCKLCGLNVFEEDHRVEVVSWVKSIPKDGAILRSFTGNIAHEKCIQKALAGIAPDQESLFSDAEL